MYREATRRVAVLAAALLALALLGCTGFGLPGGALRLNQGDNGRSSTLAVGQELIVTLPSNPSTGYRWQVTAGDATVLAQAGEAQYASEGIPRPGSGGTETFRFRAVAAGSTMLRLSYAPSYDPSAAPAETFDLSVTVR
jgi:inhibitor of cysteine peptidase